MQITDYQVYPDSNIIIFLSDITLVVCSRMGYLLLLNTNSKLKIDNY